jgi:hypothetical protein
MQEVCGTVGNESLIRIKFDPPRIGSGVDPFFELFVIATVVLVRIGWSLRQPCLEWEGHVEGKGDHSDGSVAGNARALAKKTRMLDYLIR